MKREDIFNAITNLRDGQVIPERKIIKIKPRIWGPIAAAILLVVGVLVLTFAPEMKPAPLYTGSAQLAAADYSQRETQADFAEKLETVPKVSGFWNESAQRFLSGGEGGNMLFSPLNLYIELCMTAELTDGESRKQILGLLDLKDIDEARETAHRVWSMSYQDGSGQENSLMDGSEMLLANSLWLDNSTRFNQDVLDTLASVYYADSFRGEPGTDEYNALFRNWLNEHTGGILEEQVSGEELGVDTVMGLASTTYFQASWFDEFDPGQNLDGKFHGPNGDTDCTFMRYSQRKFYYWGEKFSAISRGLYGYNQMLLVLPDEGVTTDELLADEEYQRFIKYQMSHDSQVNSEEEWENSEFVELNLSLPKFDISAKSSLTEGLQEMGVTDMFDRRANSFRPLSEDPLYVDDVHQACRVMVDEEGCTGASYVAAYFLGADNLRLKQVDFTLDRPFIFTVITAYGLPLYMGVVNEP